MPLSVCSIWEHWSVNGVSRPSFRRLSHIKSVYHLTRTCEMNLAVKNNKQLQRKKLPKVAAFSLTFINGTKHLENYSQWSQKKTVDLWSSTIYMQASHTHFLLNLDVFFLLKKSHVTFLGLFSLAQLKLSWMSTISCIVSFKKHLIVFLTNSREKRKTHNKIKPIITKNTC